jgi:hypothetical protein
MYYIDAIGRRRQLSEPNKPKTVRSQLLTVRQVPEWLNVSPSWVRDHATNRHRPALPSLKLGKSRAQHRPVARRRHQPREPTPQFRLPDGSRVAAVFPPPVHRDVGSGKRLMTMLVSIGACTVVTF